MDPMGDIWTLGIVTVEWPPGARNRPKYDVIKDLAFDNTFN